MTGEHGGCCCNHEPDDDVDQHDEIVRSPEIQTVTASAQCCGAKEEKASRSKDHAGHPTAVRSQS